MRFLTYAESAGWCARRGYPTRKREGYIVGPEPDIQAHEFQRDVVFVSHDEFGWFGSRDVSVAGSMGQQLKDALGADSSSKAVQQGAGAVAPNGLVQSCRRGARLSAQR